MPLSPVMGWGVAGFPLCLLTLVCRIALAPDLCGQYPPVIRGEGGGRGGGGRGLGAGIFQYSSDHACVIYTKREELSPWS